MADVMPNPRVGMQKLRQDILQVQARIEGRKLALLELVDRRDRELENWEADSRALEQMQENLRLMEESHGAITEEEIEEAKTTPLDDAVPE